MPTNRQTYFALTKSGNKYLNRNVVLDMLLDTNGLNDRMVLYRTFDEEVKNYEQFNLNVQRVMDGEPVQYVLGYTYFLGHEIIVNNNVLIPRQETEQLVINTIVNSTQLFKDIQSPTIADVCTGSGCIAVALKKQYPNATVVATDISEKALGLAKKNADINKVDIDFLQGDLLEPLIQSGKKFDVLVCNPPYIEDVSRIDEQVFKYEPHLALLAKPATMFYERIFKDVEKIMNNNYILAFEIDEDMQKPLSDLMAKYFDGVMFKFIKDMYGKMRFLYIIK